VSVLMSDFFCPEEPNNEFVKPLGFSLELLGSSSSDEAF
jgi:hypothetical protein